MATFKLTAGDDVRTGTDANDVFDGFLKGVPGGFDTLNGGGGDDRFILSVDAYGTTIDGGTGTDRLTIEGSFEANLNIYAGLTGVEILDIRSKNGSEFKVSAAMPMISAFASIAGPGNAARLSVNILGEGGSIDFASRMLDHAVDFSAELASSGVVVFGTRGNDRLQSSGYDDAISGGEGDDVIVGVSTFGDIGRDKLQGGGGKDRFEGWIAAGGVVDGGSGTDTFAMSRLYGVTVKNVEVLEIMYGLDASLADIAKFKTIRLGTVDIEPTITLHGKGGSLDLRGSYRDGGVTLHGQGLASGIEFYGTKNRDLFFGSNFDDVFRTGSGDDSIVTSKGRDLLLGEGGDDNFMIREEGSGLIDGGDGFDEVTIGRLYGGSNSLYNFKFKNVEQLGVDGVVYATIDQIAPFKKIFDSREVIDEPGIEIRLHGAGGKLDLSGRDIEALHIVDAGLTSSCNFRGTSQDDSMQGSRYADDLDGGDGADELLGGASGDRLRGGLGDDTLDGGTGRDVLEGGKGDDVYLVDSRRDTVTEATGAGTDAIVSTVSMSLKNVRNVERLGLLGPRTLEAIGDDADNVLGGNGAGSTLKGEKGSDTLYGGPSDRLWGGKGDDFFAFDVMPGKGAAVIIEDFKEGDDLIALYGKAFGIGTDAYLTGRRFKDLADGRADGDDRVLYDSDKGDLFYDKDGSGTRYAAVHLAHLNGRPSLDADDILGF